MDAVAIRTKLGSYTWQCMGATCLNERSWTGAAMCCEERNGTAPRRSSVARELGLQLAAYAYGIV